jgi:hypothetical protein
MCTQRRRKVISSEVSVFGCSPFANLLPPFLPPCSNAVVLWHKQYVSRNNIAYCLLRLLSKTWHRTKLYAIWKSFGRGEIKSSEENWKKVAKFCRLLFLRSENFRCASLCWSKVVNNWLWCHFQSSFHGTNPHGGGRRNILHWTLFHKNLIAFVDLESIKFIESDEEVAMNYWTLSLEIVQAQV